MENERTDAVTVIPYTDSVYYQFDGKRSTLYVNGKSVTGTAIMINVEPWRCDVTITNMQRFDEQEVTGIERDCVLDVFKRNMNSEFAANKILSGCKVVKCGENMYRIKHPNNNVVAVIEKKSSKRDGEPVVMY